GTLLIVESPTKAKSLSLFLGKKYVVKASMGHLRDLPKSQLGVEVEQEFKPKYIAVRGKGKIIKELKEAVKNANQVLLASDPDREGEAIAWHLQNLLELKSDEPCRVEFNEITKQSVIQALENPRYIDYNRVNAQQARRILDRLVGYNLSPLLWRKIKKGLSAGRVQSAALRLICDREEEIKAFIPEEYWSLTAKLSKDEKNYFLARLYKIGNKKAALSHQDEVENIIRELAPCPYQVIKKERTEKSRQPVTPFTTSSLQQEASRKLNFTPQKTMLLAQQLYEGLGLGPEGTTGLITYIRTDSMRVAESIQEEARLYIKRHFGTGYIPLRPRKIKPKGRIQDAHEAIRPTSVGREPQTIKTYLT
ncbi:MAG TPA: type I DNA topoisomerase, partial [Desulfotomaculum sp.]|nr:type I DNA topoisomerase [Desulfotomaculum sp.]